jgi:hypothetical protein
MPDRTFQKIKIVAMLGEYRECNDLILVITVSDLVFLPFYTIHDLKH